MEWWGIVLGAILGLFASLGGQYFQHRWESRERAKERENQSKEREKERQHQFQLALYDKRLEAHNRALFHLARLRDWLAPVTGDVILHKRLVEVINEARDYFSGNKLHFTENARTRVGWVMEYLDFAGQLELGDSFELSGEAWKRFSEAYDSILESAGIKG